MPARFIPPKIVFINALETALNAYLHLDDQVERLLRPLAGKVIAIDISTFGGSIYLCPSEQRIQILESYDGHVDAKLKGSLSALGLMGISASPMHALFKKKVIIEGDAAVAHKLQSLLTKLDINLEDKLAAFTGRQFARSLSHLFRDSRDWSKQSLISFGLNLQEYLQEETRDLPAKPEADLFFQEIDTCRCDYERLNARVERLNTILNQSSAQQNLSGLIT